MLLFEARGRKSGRRAVTLLYWQKGDVMYVVASNGGRREHPEWLLNVRAHPEVSVQIGATRFAAIAHEIPSTNDPELWRDLVQHYRGWGDYRQITQRTISVVELVAT